MSGMRDSVRSGTRRFSFKPFRSALEQQAGRGKSNKEVPTSEKLSPSWAELAADGSGGVRAAGEGQGVRALVVSAASDSAAVVCL